MYVKRNISTGLILKYAWPVLLFAVSWSGLVFSLYYFLNFDFISIPFQPLSVIGIAVAFFIGFKNNQSYDRFWEGRKIWGAIVNYSRTWANQSLHLLSESDKITKEELKKEQRVLIYRHLAWLHTLRLQLRKPVSFSLKNNSAVEKWHESHNDHEDICAVLKPYLSESDSEDISKRQNVATHLIKLQAAHLKRLKEKFSLMDGFNYTMFMNTLEQFYNFQGKCERIKNTPFPRQYAYFSKVFAYIFVLLLPFGLLDIFLEEMHGGAHENYPQRYIFLLMPVSVLVSWIFLTWEIIGDNSEDPFEGRVNDVPMTALTRTIEIDLRDMLDEEKLPPKLAAKDNVLY